MDELKDVGTVGAPGVADVIGVKKKRGFATMDRALVSEIARKGGKAAHAPGGRGHKFTSEEAREAGRKGGQASQRRRADVGGAR